ncbi:dihydrofolate reductase family protein [Actinocrispum wychmicini]|uniref:Dihydrofolate reductase n=1 Tax=Actinocrispum wychmicini TaxID=1213861 RepID=A0A4R2JAS1_9PSEU|nr:dihydrofolate reductase family protein [Actinocrispum wychmicini]TCO54962.1 dihydrofolate reductase [Actinocrispum wychmicini]
MRKVILYVNVTLDGMLAGPHGELDWMLPDPEMNQTLSDELRDRVDTILTGRNFYYGADQSFRAQAADPASPPELVSFANWVVDTPKVVFSTTLTTLDDGSRVAANIPTEIAALRDKPGKDMVLFGGSSTAQQFIQHSVVDEYWIKLYPVVLGAGQPMFTDLSQRANLELVHSKSHTSGIVTLRYYSR